MAEQQPISQHIQQTDSIAHRDDEIDLADLFAKMWQRKWWVVGLTAIVVTLAVVYLQIAKPVYRAALYLMPPSVSDLQALNLETPYFIHRLSPEDSYREMLNQLRSKRQMREFFDEADIQSIYRSSANQTDYQVFKNFEKALSINLPQKGDVVFSSVFLEGPFAEDVAETLNAYVNRVKNYVLARQLADLIEARDRKIEQFSREIDSKRQFSKLKREDRIQQLEEAFAVARAVGIKELGLNTSNRVAGQNINIMNVSTLFMRGTDALGAEIEVLKSRTSDDPFIDELRGLQERVENLSSIKIDSKLLSPVHIDMQAVVPEQSVKPKKLIILALSIILGLVGGIFVALVIPLKNPKPRVSVGER